MIKTREPQLRSIQYSPCFLSYIELWRTFLYFPDTPWLSYADVINSPLYRIYCHTATYSDPISNIHSARILYSHLTSSPHPHGAQKCQLFTVIKEVLPTWKNVPPWMLYTFTRMMNENYSYYIPCFDTSSRDWRQMWQLPKLVYYVFLCTSWTYFLLEYINREPDLPLHNAEQRQCQRTSLCKKFLHRNCSGNILCHTTFL